MLPQHPLSEPTTLLDSGGGGLANADSVLVADRIEQLDEVVPTGSWCFARRSPLIERGDDRLGTSGDEFTSKSGIETQCTFRISEEDVVADPEGTKEQVPVTGRLLNRSQPLPNLIMIGSG
jgi:hypothetical protein